MQAKSPVEKLQRASRKEAGEAQESLQATETAPQLQLETLQERITTNKEKLITAKDLLEQKIAVHRAVSESYQVEKFAGAEPDTKPQYQDQELNQALLEKLGISPEETAKWASYQAELSLLAKPAQPQTDERADSEHPKQTGDTNKPDGSTEPEKYDDKMPPPQADESEVETLRK